MKVLKLQYLMSQNGQAAYFRNSAANIARFLESARAL